MNAERKFLTVREVAEILGINLTGTYRLIKGGRLRAHRFSPRRLRIHVKEVERFTQEAFTAEGLSR